MNIVFQATNDTRFCYTAFGSLVGGVSSVGIKANVEATATVPLGSRTSVTVKTTMEVVMATTKRAIAGLLVGSMLLWGLVTSLQRRSGSGGFGVWLA